MFQNVRYYPGDPILGLIDKYNVDPNPNKVNLGVGVYYDNEGRLPILECVKTVEKQLAQQNIPHNYLPMDGLAGYRQACQNLLFGTQHEAVQSGRIATIASLGGSGALRVGAEFIHQWFPRANIYVSNPTWGNHISIFEGAGFTVKKYPYYDPATNGLKIEELKQFLQQLDAGNIILLHPCCHNPTGIDPTASEWDELLTIIKEKKLIPFMDFAYQGLGDDLEQDTYAIRKAVDLGFCLYISNSFSKNMSLYGERVGALSVVCPNQEQAKIVQSQLKFIIRRFYSSPPGHGNYIVDQVLNNADLFNQWQQEVTEMRERIHAMRFRLHEVLQSSVPGRDFSFLTKQRGMFSFTGLNSEQVARLQSEFSIYIVENGRMCIAGLNTKNIDYVAEAMAKVLT
ncbi:aspartate/tyrosine/aromatic aminotransferase [Snodgrassella sp. B3882]|uniref:amino acid aminotransferase n=1 Tax=Snodgrassella sp. B3882 TaxID=2818037 RepID=UPI00226A8FA6|nr:amino acid aminotransferase [Snodgrassella sp. B3882]MCX8744500.1 aspartate/tyrosine/aromatic aminotransferase [Snodgrassella sp. B3882]